MSWIFRKRETAEQQVREAFSPHRAPKFKDVSGIASAPTVWMFASQDNNAILTYQGVAERMIMKEEDVKSVVRDWRELFRPGANPADLKKWKKDLQDFLEKEEKTGELQAKYPNSFRQIQEKDGKEVRNWESERKFIDKLNNDHMFRSQFRLTKDAKQSDLETIRLGLDFIERNRLSWQEYESNKREAILNAQKEERERRFGRRTFGIGVATVAAGVLTLALSTCVTSVGNNLKKVENDLKSQEIELKKNEEQSKESSRRLDNYSSFGGALSKLNWAALNKNKEQLLSNCTDVVSKFLDLAKGDRQAINSKYKKITSLCADLAANRPADQIFPEIDSGVRELMSVLDTVE
jgi:hypothetical protein